MNLNLTLIDRKVTSLAFLTCSIDSVLLKTPHSYSRFKIKSILKSHMKVHDGDKQYLCYFCGWSFAQGEDHSFYYSDLFGKTSRLIINESMYFFNLKLFWEGYKKYKVDTGVVFTLFSNSNMNQKCFA